MRIACTNCGQVMEVADQTAGQVVSCARCRTNIQIPTVARPAAAPTQNVTVQVGAPMVGSGAAPVRHYGRGVGITLGILVLFLLVIPLQITPPAQGAQGSTIQVAWPWAGAVNAAKATQVQAWLVYLIPAMVGVLAIIGAALPSPVRGFFLWLAGLGLLLGVTVIKGIPSGALAGYAIETWAALLLLPLLWMAVGGHGAAMRGAGGGGARMGVGLPTLLFLGALGTIIGVAASRGQLTGQTVVVTPMLGQPASWEGWVQLLLSWAGPCLLGVSVLLGFVNLFAGKRGVGTAGYVLGLLGVICFFGAELFPRVYNLIAGFQGKLRFDYLGGVGGFLHGAVPLVFGVMLIFSGWGSMWKLDRPAVVQVNP